MVRYKIGEIAKLLGLTAQAIRFYEEQGVITPERGENGTRYYTVDHAVLLLSFKKYRQSDFSVQEIVDHFRCDELSRLLPKLDAQTARLQAQASYFSRKADDMHEFAAFVRDTQENKGVVRETVKGDGYMLNVPLDRLKHANAKELKDLTVYIDAMPGTGICFMRDVGAAGDATLYMCASKAVAGRWNLPMEHAQLVPAQRCAVYCERFGQCPWNEPYIEKSLAAVRRAGFTPDERGQIMGMHIASETVEGKAHLSARIYVPVL